MISKIVEIGYSVCVESLTLLATRCVRLVDALRCPVPMAHENYTQDELNALKGIFSLYDPDKTGSISTGELQVLDRSRGHH